MVKLKKEFLFFILIVFSCFVCIFLLSESTSSFLVKKNNYVYVASGIKNNTLEVAYKEKNIDTILLNEIKNFMVYFFNVTWTLQPNGKFIQEAYLPLFEYGDKSIKRLYKTLNTSNFFAQLINDNISLFSKIKPSDVSVKMNSYPYSVSGKFVVNSEMRKEKTGEFFVQSFVYEFSCLIKHINRTEKNPHGLFIEKLELNSVKN